MFFDSTLDWSYKHLYLRALRRHQCNRMALIWHCCSESDAHFEDFVLELLLNAENFVYSPLLLKQVCTQWTAVGATNTTDVFEFCLSQCFRNLLVMHTKISISLLCLKPVSSLLYFSLHFGRGRPCSCPLTPLMLSPHSHGIGSN